jgi:hypothetical protein
MKRNNLRNLAYRYRDNQNKKMDKEEKALHILKVNSTFLHNLLKLVYKGKASLLKVGEKIIIKDNRTNEEQKKSKFKFSGE